MVAQPVRQFADASLVTLLHGADAVGALALAGRLTAHRPGNVFQDPAMLRRVAETLQERGAHCVTAAISRDGAIETIWPLRIAREMGVTVATDLTAPISQYSDVIGKPIGATTLHDIGRQLRGECAADAIFVRHVRGDSGLREAFAADGATVIEAGEAPFVDLSAFGNYEAYTASFSNSTVRKMRQRRKRLEAGHGPLSFEILPGPQARYAVELAFDWKRGWLREQIRSSRVLDGALNQRLLLEASSAPNARASMLRAGGTPVAVELGFACARHYVAYLGTFDPDFAGFSVGQEQMLRTIAWCYEQDFDTYDLLFPADAYKRHWTRRPTAEPVRDYGLALSGLGGMYLFARRHAQPRVRRTVQAVPPAMRKAAKKYGKTAVVIGAAGAAVAAASLLND